MLEVYPHLNKIHVPFLAATGPLWYLYVRALLTGKRWSAVDIWHLLPVVSSLVLLLPFFIQSAQFKREYVEINITGLVALLAYASTRIAEMAAIVYLIVVIWALQPERAVSGPIPAARSNPIVLTLTSVAVVAAITRLYGSVVGNHTVSVGIPIVIMLASFIGLFCVSYRHPRLLIANTQVSREKGLSTESAELLEHYSECIRSNRWHLDPNLKIQLLARRLGVPPHDLSELINRQSGNNFNHFINAIRIEHAKQQLFEHPDTPVLDIALASGFNSVSAFYAQFTRFESMPPATYRRRLKASAETVLN